MLRLRRKVATQGAIALVVAALLGCRSQSVGKRTTIVFDDVPPLGQGGAGETGTVRGHVVGAHLGQRVVLYVQGGNTWWIQPLTVHPFTALNGDGSWSSPTHLGSQYAALLVEPGYVPPNTIPVLPPVGSHILAIAKTAPSPTHSAVPEKEIRFSDYDWKVRSTGSDRNGAPHDYDPANAGVDARGFLHLKMTKGGDGWVCSEVSLPRSLGYGTYAFSVEDVSGFEPATVLSMFTWDDAGTDQNRRELDLELSRWGEPDNKNAQYVVQPFYRPANTYRYMAPPGLLTYIFRWEPRQIAFRTLRGGSALTKTRPVAEHTFTSGIPVPRTESVHLNFCTFDYAQVPQQQPSEVVLERFVYLP